ncbi:MAB_1171c family putative transporter [Streptomyces olivaceus]
MSLVVYLAAVVFGMTSVLLLRRPRTALRNPLAVSTCVAIVLGALVLACAAPVTLRTVNELTGVTNFGAPLTYGMLSAYSCAVLVLLINWRGGPRPVVRRMVLRSMAAYGLLVAAIVVLFLLADADTERLTDLDTYYAGTPFMREMILLYLFGHSAAMLVMCAVCVKWGREVGGLLRTGLHLILLGSLLDVVGFSLTKYTAVVARWAGHDLDFLSTTVAPPMASLAALLCSAGFALPRLLPPVLAHRRGLEDYRRLAPLWSLVRSVSTAPAPPSAWWQLPRDRLQWREVSIHDALLTLAPYFDHRLRTRVRDSALREGRSAHDARLTAEAAMLTDAARRAAAREEPPEAAGTYRLHATEVSGPSGLVELAQALHRPPGRPAAPCGAQPPAASSAPPGSTTTRPAPNRPGTTRPEPEEPHVA